jgi:hypothetical protein
MVIRVIVGLITDIRPSIIIGMETITIIVAIGHITNCWASLSLNPPQTGLIFKGVLAR